jgi:flagellar P-ring protein FlgI
MKRCFKNSLRKPLCLSVLALALAALLTAPAQAQRIRDVARLKNDAPSELIGMGLVVGLKGTGDGGDYMATIRRLKSAMAKFGDSVTLEKELKNASNVALVQLKVAIPPQGVHSGEKLDIIVSSIGAAKSLKGGQLFLAPLLFPQIDRKLVLAMGSGECMLDDESHPTTARINGGAVLIEDVLSEEIKGGKFTLVLHPNTANAETATAIADQINEDVSAQTGGKPAAVAVDATSVDVTIPAAEMKNVTAFMARIRSLPLPNIPDPAKVIINTKSKDIIFGEEVELSPTIICCKSMTIDISGTPAPIPGAPGTAATDSRVAGNAKLKDLVEAFRLYKVSPDDRIAIVKQLHDKNALKAELEIQ